MLAPACARLQLRVLQLGRKVVAKTDAPRARRRGRACVRGSAPAPEQPTQQSLEGRTLPTFRRSGAQRAPRRARIPPGARAGATPACLPPPATPPPPERREARLCTPRVNMITRPPLRRTLSREGARRARPAMENFASLPIFSEAAAFSRAMHRAPHGPHRHDPHPRGVHVPPGRALRRGVCGEAHLAAGDGLARAAKEDEAARGGALVDGAHVGPARRRGHGHGGFGLFAR